MNGKGSKEARLEDHRQGFLGNKGMGRSIKISTKVRILRKLIATN
jgi:hypothetical protein